MAARVCAKPTCQIRYPTYVLGGAPVTTCVACGNPTTWTGMENPHGDWEDRVKAAQRRIETERLFHEIRKDIPLTSDPLRVYTHDGKSWVKQSALRRAGINIHHSSESFQLFIANGCVWETQAWHERLRRWWIEKVLCLEDVEE